MGFLSIGESCETALPKKAYETRLAALDKIPRERYAACMAVDRDLLDKARQAAREVQAAEQGVREALDRYRVAVRRLHVAGVPLREIAAQLHLSHQRVHQLVEGVSAAKRRWKIKHSPQTPLMCTFCRKDSAHVAKLVAGPNVCICDACIHGSERFDRVHPDSTLRCSFCGKPRSRVTRMFAANDAQMCGECTELARDIIEAS